MRWTFGKLTDEFVADMKAAGRINSPGTERAYRDVLGWHAEDCEDRDPRRSTDEHVLETLGRWDHRNTKRNRLAVLSSFYRWMVRKGYRRDNPCDRIDRPRRAEPDTKRITTDEALALLDACETPRERRVLFLGVLAGARNVEIRRLKGKHFQRAGVIRIAPDVGKGRHPRQLPVLPELAPVVAEIRANVGREEYVVPAQRRDPQAREWFDVPSEQASGQAVWRLVRRVADRAGVDCSPHALRRAFADLVLRSTRDVKLVQELLGHRSLDTTETYLSRKTLDQLQSAVLGVKLDASSARSKVRVRPSQSSRRTVSPSSSTSTGSVSISPFTASIEKTSVSMDTPREIRTPVSAVRGRRPSPLDDGGAMSHQEPPVSKPRVALPSHPDWLDAWLSPLAPAVLTYRGALGA